MKKLKIKKEKIWMRKKKKINKIMKYKLFYYIKGLR